MSNNSLSDSVKSAEKRRRKKAGLLILALAIALVLGYAACISFGSVRMPVSDVWGALFGHGTWGNQMIVNDIRAPRVACSAIAGAALSLGGLAMQALFKNPMASPTVLGVSSGASFGAAFCIAYGSFLALGSFGIMACAFVAAMGTLLLVYLMAYEKVGGVRTTMLLIAGMAISALFSGLTSIIEFFSDEETVTSIVFWMLGSFDGCTWEDATTMGMPLIIGILIIALHARELNLISTGESKARSLGVNVRFVRLLVLVGSSLMVAAVVSICGIIGFVGLIIPHIFRTLVGPDHKKLVPLCILGGALFLMIVDTFARSVMPPYELPVGAITSVIGAPFFLWILKSRKSEIWRC